MKEFAFALELSEASEAEAAYRREHTQVWPEVISSIRAVGILEEKIFLLGRMLFMYLVTEDDFEPARDFARYLTLPRAREWDEFMRPLQQRVRDAGPDEWWAEMEKVFDLNWSQYR